MPDYYTAGQTAVLEALGISKVATPVIVRAPLLRRAGWWLQKKLPQWGKSLKEMAIGEPGKFVDELSRGKALSKGSLVRKSFHAPGMLNKVFWYGLPAYEGVQILRDDDPDKWGRMGGLIGGTALGIGAFRPLGIVGSMGAGMLGEHIGAGIARTGRQLAKGNEPIKGRWESSPQNHYATPQYYAPQNTPWVNQ